MLEDEKHITYTYVWQYHSQKIESFNSYYSMALQQVVQVKSQLARAWCHEFNSSDFKSRWNKKERHRKA